MERTGVLVGAEGSLASPLESDVIVIGGGPTGLAVAALLALGGTRVVVIDPNAILCQHPRATHIDDETMRLLQTLGAADEANFRRHMGHQIMNANGDVLVSLKMDGPRGDQGWWTDYQFHQPDFEARVRGALAVSPIAELLLGWTAVDVAQDGTGVTVVVEDVETRLRRSVRGKYVVAADGAGSSVRRALGIEVEDLHGTQTSLIVDVFPFEHPDSLDYNRSFIRSSSGWPITYIPVAPPMLRFERMLRQGDDKRAQADPINVYAMLSPWLEPGSYRIMRTDVYEWHSQLATQWRRGRILLAGDAVHTMPPMLGQGVCSGFRDAMNLAWKLSAVVSGRSPDRLLDTYETERIPHVRPFIEESARQANIIESTDASENGQPTGPIEVTEIVLAQFRPHLGAGLLPELEQAKAQLAPQPSSDEGVRFDDFVGYRFALYVTHEAAVSLSADAHHLLEALDAVVVAEPSESFRQWAEEHQCDSLVVRPDRYVYAACRAELDLDASLAKLATTLGRA